VATFNRDAAAELSSRIAARLAPHAPLATRIEVRTLHALARQVLRDAVGPRELVADRLPLLRRLLRQRAHEVDATAEMLPDAAQLDGDISAWKMEGRVPRDSALVEAYSRLLVQRNALDFDDLVVEAVRLLEHDAMLRKRWQRRFTHVCVDEFQDVDAGQLRLVRLLAAPDDNLFVVGDDDQTIYAWRLADVRRILSFETLYPNARRVQLATNYRCPPMVVVASRNLIEANVERFAKRIDSPPGAASHGPAAEIATVRTVDRDWDSRMASLAAVEASAGRTLCFLARTRSELLPVMAALVRRGIAHATSVPPLLASTGVTELVAAAGRLDPGTSPLGALGRLRRERGWRRADGPEDLGDDDHAALDALLGWSVRFRRMDAFLEALAAIRARQQALLSADATIELVTVHAAKGREWQTVVVLGMEEDRFPNRRSILEAREPSRALEEERRLAYVAMTRATRTLVLAFDPDRTSRFVAEAGIACGRPRG
jgi:DNA helicase-2/ATP-dependent DNA helicase PcrA